MSFIQGLASKIGIPGVKKYRTQPATPTFQGLDLRDKLKAIVATIATQDKTAKQRRNLTYYLSALYYQGYQNVELSASGNSFDVYERDDFYVENQYRKHVDTVKGMLNKMEATVLARPGSDSPEDIACARVSDSVLSSMRDTIGYERLKDQKNLYRCLFGTAFLFSDYVVDKKYGVVVSPKYEYQEQQIPADPTDPMSQPETMVSKVAVGFERRNKGSEIAIACSPLEIDIRPDMKGGLESVPYLSWHTQQDTDILNYVYPGLNIVGGNNASTEDLAQQYLETLANLPGNLVGDSPIYNRQTMVNRVELRRTWLQPCTFRGDKELLKEFPDGVHVTTVAGDPVDWYAEVLADRWTYEVLIPVPHSLLGDGLFDAILQQDQINEMNSLFIKHLRYSTVGKNLYDAAMIDPKDIVNDPANGWVAVRNIGMDKKVSDAVKQLPPSTLSQDVTAWLQHSHDMMEDMTSAFDSNTGKGMGANTPYSQSVFLSEKAQGRWASSGQYNEPELIRFHRSLLNIARDNWIDPRKRAFQTQTGEWSFEQFSQADLQGQVEIMLTDADMKPQSRAEQVQAMTMLVQLAPIMPGMPPRQKLRIEEMLGLPPDANPASNQISRAYRIIDRICKGETVTPLPLVDDAQAQIPVFQDWLASEKGESQAMADPQIYSNVYLFMVTLLQQGLAHQQSPVPGLLGPQQPADAKGQGSPAAPPTGKVAGGQNGQKGGGPGSMDQPEAQSPAPAPPVSPPSPTA